MSSIRINHRAIALPAMAACILWVAPVFAQQKPGGGGGTVNNGGGANTGAAPGNIPTGNTPTGNPGSVNNGPFGNRNQTTTPFPSTQPQMQTPIFLSGQVMFDDG